ncbi:hypothetical protein [Polaromonas sp. YR568]|uniref:hypothetical protein n=1 Tax=Polaromonas sp. YR568 TaxID=1855301 RepID=UPI0031381148
MHKSKQNPESEAGFVAGTLAHTREGLRPIEQLKVGDEVLSRPENPAEGTGTVYKRVVNTSQHKNKQVLRVEYMVEENGVKKYAQVTTTVDHPFWVIGEGWTAANGILGNWMGPSRLILKDATEIDAEGKIWVYATNDPDVGWIAVNGTEGAGALWDYAQSRLVEAIRVYDFEAWSSGPDDTPYLPFTTPVYNIEVEDYHTYFVGTHGVWVHDADCARIKPVSGATPKRQQ